MAQSPLLSAYAEGISLLVPGLEIAIALFLLIPRYQTLALYASFTLMVFFTAYIYIILHYSDFIPCSCGGVLEQLSWTQHLLFNIGFIILAALAVLVVKLVGYKKKLFLLVFLFVFGVSFMVVLFVFSEKKMHRNNGFQRILPHHPATETNKIDIRYDSYYIAGTHEDSIYLGNGTAPLHMLTVHKTQLDTTEHTITLPYSHTIYRDLTSKFIDGVFYMMDGTVPVIYKGYEGTYTATHPLTIEDSFIRALPLNDTIFAVRVFDPVTGGNILGQLSIDAPTTVTLHPSLLEAQGDPFFDTDGLLLFNRQLQKIIYVYFYRNEFVVIDRDFSLDYRGRTIDTISKSQLDVRTISSKNEKKLGANPTFVHLQAATYGRYLFIVSDRVGKYESEKILEQASIIDVYDLETSYYAFSFYLYHPGLKKLKELSVEESQLTALVDHFLITYALKTSRYTPIE
nr:MauE/DoxX family redox-associated membrane protein [Ulvibacter litoralis]